MFGIIKKELKERRLSLMIFILVALLLTWVYIVLFPTVRDQAQSLNKLVETYPEALKKAFKIEGGGFDSLETFFSYELFSLMWPLLAIMLTLSRAGNAIAGEVERKTIGTLLAQPISRTKLFLSKYTSGLISLGLFVVASILSPIILAWAYHYPVFPRNFLLTAVFSALFSLVIFSVAMLVSATLSDRSKVYGIMGGTLFTMYVINVISGIKPSLDKLKFASIFHYFDATNVLIHARLPVAICVWFVIIASIATVAGIAVFNKRDISI